jgi:putative spermidine/putrescine transport system ATP-binding protein
MSAVRFESVEKKYGKNFALKNFSLDVSEGEFVTLLGPSGCGKTTALRIIAGLVAQSAGSIYIGQKEVTGLPTSRRNIGMVFQAYSLFPNLTARANMEFGLRAKRASEALIKERIDSLLEVTGLIEHQHKFPHQLSGGQQQRVALVRALVTQPSLLLLDEPLSALDAQVRVQIREEVRRLQRELGTTTIFVTHDQEEAMSISDRVGVMQNGNLLQISDPQTLYRNPQDPFVARFFGTVNEIPAIIDEKGRVRIWDLLLPTSQSEFLTGSAVTALVRPESLRLGKSGVPGKVTSISFLGPITHLDIRSQTPSRAAASGPGMLRVVLPSTEVADLRIGSEIYFKIEDKDLYLVPSQNK